MYGEIRTKREAAMKRWGQLSAERSSWMSHWQELSKYFLPRSGRFFETGAAGSPNRGDKKHQHIYDNTAIRALNVLTAGLMAGMTSPARPWFRLRTPDEKLNERAPVKKWLHDVAAVMRETFTQANTYRAFRQMYEELGCFGTSPNIVVPNFDRVIHNFPLTAGEYAIDTNAFGEVDTIYRRFDMSVGQMVGMFGLKRCSTHVQNLYNAGNLASWQEVLHVIEPRRERNPLKLTNDNMPYASCYYEVTANEDEYLRISGYRSFRAVAPRWQTRAADVYGSSPGMIALGDTKQLQHQQFRKSQAIDFQTLPPLQVPTANKDSINLTPGRVNGVDVVTSGARSMFDVNLNLNDLLQDINDVRFRVKQAFFEDLFLMIVNMPGVQPRTVEEIVERKEEKLLMLGPVLESLHDEMLGPYIELVFSDLLEAGMIPPAPPELQGKQLIVQFVSMLAQAQQMIGLGSIDRLLGTVMNVGQVKPEIADKINTDKLVDIYSDILGVDPDLVVAGEQVALIRQQRAQAQQAAMAVEAAPKVAQAAKTASEVDQTSAAADALNQLGGL